MDRPSPNPTPGIGIQRPARVLVTMLVLLMDMSLLVGLVVWLL